jgi:hypothetical protein
MVVAAAVLGTPGTAAAQRCDPPVRVVERNADTPTRSLTLSAIVDCRGRVLVRRRLRRYPVRVGTVLIEADRHGRRLAWTELTVGRYTSAVRLVDKDRTGIRRRVLWRDDDETAAPRAGVAFAGGRLAWTAARRVVVEGRGTVARGRFVDGPLAAEDGRTLRFAEYLSWRWVDLRRARADGCARRRGWATVTRTADAVITRRTYDAPDEGFEEQYGAAFRACAPATGRDPVVAQESTRGQAGTRALLVGVDGSYVTFHTYGFSYMDSSPGVLEVFRAGEPRPVSTQPTQGTSTESSSGALRATT